MENRSGAALDEAGIGKLAGRILRRIGLPEGELGVSFVAADEMQALNKAHMSRDYVTDVLSFPIDAGGTGGEEAGSSGDVPELLGDVVICPQVAREQADAEGTSLDAELCLLVIHGILHIAGMDHETDGGEMDKKQAGLFEELCGR